MDPFFRQEFIPESTRDAIAANAEAAHGVSVQALKWAGNAAWIVTTSMLVLAVPVCFLSLCVGGGWLVLCAMANGAYFSVPTPYTLLVRVPWFCGYTEHCLDFRAHHCKCGREKLERSENLGYDDSDHIPTAACSGNRDGTTAGPDGAGA